MKQINFFATAFVVASVWASTINYLGLFAKIDDNYAPLTFEDIAPESFSVITYSASTEWPSQVYFFDNDAFTISGKVGFWGPNFGHGPDVKKTRLTLDRHNKINREFYRCPLGRDRGDRITARDVGGCVRTEVYLLDFDRNTGAAIKKDEISPYYDYDDVPRALFVYHDGGSTHVIPSSDGTTLLFGQSALSPVPFYRDGSYLFSKGGAERRFLGLDQGNLVYSTSILGVKLDFDEDMMITNPYLYACRNPEDRSLFNITTNSDCDYITVYLLPYDKNAVGTYLEKFLSKSEVFVPDATEFPLVFFAKVDDRYYPLSSVFREESYSRLSYGHSVAPVEFTLNDNHASPLNTIVKGYATFYSGRFGVGPESISEKLKLDLDENGKLQNGAFYSCTLGDSSTHDITESSQRAFGTCFEVEIYLREYDRKTGLMKDPLDAPEKESNEVPGNVDSEKESNEVTGSDETCTDEDCNLREENSSKKGRF